MKKQKIRITIHVDTNKVPNKLHLDALNRFPARIAKNKKVYNRQQYKKLERNFNDF